MLPSTLEYIGFDAFDKCGFIGELKLPEKLKYIGEQAFCWCPNFVGTLILPENLQYLGASAFAWTGGFTYKHFRQLVLMEL